MHPKSWVGELGLQRQQDAEEAAVTSTSASALGSESLPTQPGAILHLVRSTYSRSRLASIGRNTFPSHLSGVLQSTFFPTFSLKKAQCSAGAFNLPDPNDSMYVAAPLTGKIVELHPTLSADTSLVAKGAVIAVSSVMKMKSVLIAPRAEIVVRRGGDVIAVVESMLFASETLFTSFST